MPNDATIELLADLSGKKHATISELGRGETNIDDMDSRFCMVDLAFTGCYCLRSSKTIDPKRPGMVWVDGKPTEPPLILSSMPMFGQMVGIHCRRWLKEYDRVYKMIYTGAFDEDGLPIPEFSFELKTLKRIPPGTQFPEHDEVVLQAAREGAVLLKNDHDALPLGKSSWVNVFGGASTVFRGGCLGAGKINPRYAIRLKEGIENYTSLRLNEELYDFYSSEQDVLPNAEMLNRAIAQNDTAVIFISRCSSEAHDGQPEKGSYYLTDSERKLVEGVRNVFKKVVAVLNVAHPIESRWIEDFHIDAVLLTGLSGMAGGRALAEILEGTVNPSGKLPNTWAEDYWDYPTAKNFPHFPHAWAMLPRRGVKYLSTTYEEGLFVGYRYFDTFKKKAAFLFGHGLSYTNFEIAVCGFFADAFPASVEIRVTNIGKTPGKEVIQLYAHIPDGKLEQPNKRLVAFAKTKELTPGESQMLTLEVSKNRVKSFDEETASWVIESGTIDFFLGASLEKANKIGSIHVPKVEMISQVKQRIPCPIEINELQKKDIEKTFPQGKIPMEYTGDDLPFSKHPGECSQKTTLLAHPEKMVTFPEVVKDPKYLDAFVGQMTDFELARLSVGGKTGWGNEDTGYAGKIFSEGIVEKYQIPDFFFADGNNGCNMFAPNIGFPVSSTMCASWNEELSFAEGKAIAREAQEMKLNCILAPAMNLQRDPLCGRHAEYFSEDPFLAGRMAGQESRGLESRGVSSCMKHLFANNAETYRSQNHSIMTERTARELYLGVFETAFEVHMPDTVMTSYNAANGSYCSDNPALLRGILREEMGFSGFFMTDWNGYGNQGIPQLIRAGINWVAPGSMDDSLVTPIVEAVRSGNVSRSELQDSVRKLFWIILKNVKSIPQ